jgi:lipopolysaccharide export system permease protein
MRISPTLTRYIGRHFSVNFITVYGALLLIVYLADSLELLRRASKRADISVATVFKMSLLKLPESGQELFAFAILFAAMYTFWRLTRTHELVVARAAGISVWEFLWPGVLVAMIIGVIKITMINPVGATMIARFDSLDSQLLRGHSSAIDISETGLWLRQMQNDNYLILHARNIEPADFTLNDVNIYLFNANDELDKRVDAPAAHLASGKWIVPDARILTLNPQKEDLDTYQVPTDLTREQIENNFASPNALSFWGMPRYIRNMEATGFSAIKVRLQYQFLLAQPFLFAGIVLVAAAITLGPPRRTNTPLIIACGTLVAFGLFFVNDVVRALGLDEIIPVTMAAWTPALLTLLLGFATLLHLEDG